VIDAGRLELALIAIATSSRDLGPHVRPRPILITKIINFGPLTESRIQRQLTRLTHNEPLRPVSLVAFRLHGHVVAYGMEDGRHGIAALARLDKRWVSARVTGEWICSP
jgi:hypothetical protein